MNRENWLNEAKKSMPGWAGLLEEIDNLLKEADPNYEIHQIKEKFGGLRFYFGADSPDVWELGNKVDEIADRSYKICEQCGTTENVSTDGNYWVLTLCTTCRREREK